MTTHPTIKIFIHKSIKLIYIIFLILNMIKVTTARSKKYNYELSNDNLLLKRCESIYHNKKIKNNYSVIKCMEKSNLLQKFGECPIKPLTPIEADCSDTCGGYDYKCLDTQKCCRHDCGRTCHQPIGLNTIEGLPPIPTNITMYDDMCRNCRTARIEWDMQWRETNVTSVVFYAIEARSHFGTTFAEHKLGKWQLQSVQQVFDIKNIDKKNNDPNRSAVNTKLNPGCWYQFRIAAVNDNGTRGYSSYSSEFQLRERPKPPRPPKNLEFGPIVYNDNSTFNTKIQWQTQKSDLPIEKYKISLSLLVEMPNRNNSLLMENDFVYAPMRSYVLKNLSKNSIYYIQVQAISLFGKKRLKSLKESKIFNQTTLQMEQSKINNLRQIEHQQQSVAYSYSSAVSPVAAALAPISRDRFERRLRNGYESEHNNRQLQKLSLTSINIRFLPNRVHGMLVKIVWNQHMTNGESLLELCKGGTECLSKSKTNDFHKIINKKNHWEFIDLDYNTKYTVRLIHITQEDKKIYKKVFITPACEVMKRKNKKMEIKC